eukprot:m.203660 g.203660  ORF g.203660 m.203660 type:complete len:122 (-) comp10114_c1_seq8:1168-1533(-)
MSEPVSPHNMADYTTFRLQVDGLSEPQKSALIAHLQGSHPRAAEPLRNVAHLTTGEFTHALEEYGLLNPRLLDTSALMPFLSQVFDASHPLVSLGARLGQGVLGAGAEHVPEFVRWLRDPE